MGTSVGPNISSDGLVFGYDTGYPIVDNDNSTIFSKGEPTVNTLASEIFGYSGITLGTDEGGTYLETNSGTTGYNYIKVPNITVSSNETYTWSFELKSEETITQSGNKYYFDTNEYSDQYSTSNDASRTGFTQIRPSSLIAGQWVKFSLSVTMKSDLTGAYSYDFLNFIKPHFTSKKIYYRNMQFEHNKSHHTPFVDGTRSSTQSLIDLKETTNIDVSNASFDSNARLSFDGTDDVITAAGLGISNYSAPFSMECVFKVPTSGTWANTRKSNVFSIAGSYAGQYGIFKESTDTIGFQIRDASTGGYCTSTGHSKDVYHHVIITFGGGSGMKLYINGELKSSNTTSFTGTPDSTNLYIGGKRAFGGSDGSFFEGEIPITKYYNKELTSAEISNKFNSIRKRFGL